MAFAEDTSAKPGGPSLALRGLTAYPPYPALVARAARLAMTGDSAPLVDLEGLLSLLL
jgi:hypothetical protein